MPQYPAHLYTEFVNRAQARGSGLGKSLRLDGSLKKLGALLRADTAAMLVTAEIGALARVRDTGHGSKLRKYREAIAFVENTFPIHPGLRQAPTGMGIEAVRYLRNPVAPTAQFPGGNINHGSLTMSRSPAQVGQDLTVPDFLDANAATTRVLLIHLGAAQGDMALNWDGIPALDHMNAVLATAAQRQIHVCILCDPHHRGLGVNVPPPGDAVCAGLRNAVNQLAPTHVRVADGGAQHSAFHDPAFAAWASTPGVDSIVVMGFDADICVRGNVFGVAEQAANVMPPRVVPALINLVDVITARPLLSGGNAGTIQQLGEWGRLCYTMRD